MTRVGAMNVNLVLTRAEERQLGKCDGGNDGEMLGTDGCNIYRNRCSVVVKLCRQ